MKFVFLNTVTIAHLAVNRYGSKPRVCNLAIPAGAEGWGSYPPACVSKVYIHLAIVHIIGHIALYSCLLSSSLFLYTWFISPSKWDSQAKTFRVQEDFTIPSPSALFLFIGENTKEGVPRPLTLSVFVAFHDLQVIRW